MMQCVGCTNNHTPRETPTSGAFLFKTMDFLEKNLEDIIYETDNKLLNQRGLWISGTKKRQLRIGNYGIADIITYRTNNIHFCNNCYSSPELLIDIYELKKDKIDFSTFLQAIKYYKGIERYLDEVRDFNWPVSYRINLIGKYIDMSDSFIFLPEFTDQKVRFYTYSYDFDGIKFKDQRRFCLTHNGF
jgi:hypothetical protein